MFQRFCITTFSFLLLLQAAIQDSLSCVETQAASIIIEITAVLQQKDRLRHAAEWGRLSHVQNIAFACPLALTNWYKHKWEPSPLHGAAKRGHTDIVAFLVAHGAPFNHQDGRERTALHEAAEQGHLAVIEFLTQHGADPNIQDVRGMLPLHLTASIGALGIIQFLINNGSEIDMADTKGETLLYKTLKMQNSPVIEYLLEHFATVGETELTLLAREYPEEYLRWLTNRRAALAHILEEEQLPRDLYNLLITFITEK